MYVTKQSFSNDFKRESCFGYYDRLSPNLYVRREKSIIGMVINQVLTVIIVLNSGYQDKEQVYDSLEIINFYKPSQIEISYANKLIVHELKTILVQVIHVSITIIKIQFCLNSDVIKEELK